MSIRELFQGGPVLYFPPTSTAEPGEVLTVAPDNETLIWAAVTPEGSLTGTPNQIATQSAGGIVQISLDPTQVAVPGSFSINAAGSQSLAFPQTRGASGQFLESDGAGNLQWATPSASGTVQGTSNQVIATPSGSNTVIGFDTQTVIPGHLTINAATAPMVFPSTNGQAGQLLSTDGSGTLSWVSESAAGGIEGTTNQITVTPSGSNSVISISNQLVLPGTLQVANYIMPSAAGTAGQVLSCQGAGNACQWSTPTSSGSISGTLGQIDVTPNGNETVISIDPNLALPGSLSIGSGVTSYTFPVARGTAGQVLETNANGVVTWQTPASGGVTQVTNTDGNLTVSPTSGAVVINTNVPTYGPASEKYTLPALLSGAVIGTDYSLKVASITGGVAALQFDAVSAGGITSVEGFANQTYVGPPIGGSVIVKLSNSIVMPSDTSEITINSATASNVMSGSTSAVRNASTNIGAALDSTSGLIVYTSSGSEYSLPLTNPTVGQILVANAANTTTWETPSSQTISSGTVAVTLPIGTASNPVINVSFSCLGTLKTINIDWNFLSTSQVQFIDSSSAFQFQSATYSYPQGCGVATLLQGQRQVLGISKWYTYTANPGSVFFKAGSLWVSLVDVGGSSFYINICLDQGDTSLSNVVESTQLFSVCGTLNGNLPALSQYQSFTFQ